MMVGGSVGLLISGGRYVCAHFCSVFSCVVFFCLFTRRLTPDDDDDKRWDASIAFTKLFRLIKLRKAQKRGRRKVRQGRCWWWLQQRWRRQRLRGRLRWRQPTRWKGFKELLPYIKEGNGGRKKGLIAKINLNFWHPMCEVLYEYSWLLLHVFDKITLCSWFCSTTMEYTNRRRHILRWRTVRYTFYPHLFAHTFNSKKKLITLYKG